MKDEIVKQAYGEVKDSKTKIKKKKKKKKEHPGLLIKKKMPTDRYETKGVTCENSGTVQAMSKDIRMRGKNTRISKNLLTTRRFHMLDTITIQF